MQSDYQNVNWHHTDLSRLNFLITGGAGFIGSHVVEYLLQHGAHKVRVLDNFSLGSLSNLAAFKDSEALEVYEGDITDAAACRNAMKDIHYVCHFAALGSVPRSIQDPVSSHHANVTGFLQVLNAAREAGVERMIYASSSAVYGNSEVMPRKEEVLGLPLSPYALTKYMNEEYAAVFSRVYNFKAIGLRFFNVFGPRQNPEGAYAAVIPRFFKAALSDKSPEIYGDGSVCRDFTYVSNVVQGCIKALFAANPYYPVYNLACGGSYSLLELWETIRKITNCSRNPVFLPPRKGDIQQSMAAIERIRTDFGFEPLVQMEEGLKITETYYREKQGR